MYYAYVLCVCVCQVNIQSHAIRGDPFRRGQSLH